MTRTMKKKMQKFTLVEIIVSMAIFTILMLVIMQLFGSLQNVCDTTSKRTQTAQNANIIMNMIANDLQSAYYDVEADAWSSWCYYQSDVELDGDTTPIWFITSRPKSVQTANSAQVLTGYWVEKVTKDEVELFALKNLTISNVDYEIKEGTIKTSELYDFKNSDKPSSKLTNVNSDLKKIAVLVDDNIISLKITPYVRKISSAGDISWDHSGNCTKLPTYVKIELQMLDDDPSVREAYKNATTTDDKNRLIRTYTRIIEINRGQQY